MKYVKPEMEIVEINNEDVILTSPDCTAVNVSGCSGGLFNYGGCDEGCSANQPH